MPYLNLDDGYSEHRKVDALSHGAFRLHTSGLCYCARELTDGHVPGHRVPRLMPDYKPAYLAELVEAEMWLKAARGFDLHDYLDWNKSREWWEAEKARKAKNKADYIARLRAQESEGN